MIGCKKHMTKTTCVPIKLFTFPSSILNNSKQPSENLSSLSKFPYSKQNSLKYNRLEISKNRLFRSKSTKTVLDKSSSLQINEYSFIDLGIEDQKVTKKSFISDSKYKKTIQTESLKDNSITFSISIESFFKNPGVSTPAALTKKPLRIRKTPKSFQNPMKDWIIFDTFSAVKPVGTMKTRKPLIQNSSVEDIKRKKKLQTWIPQPRLYCKSPITVNSESRD
ncbi:hypothetical protein SteCoe_6492 [Stentor coeruleus]|uniref:Uncharacterized protein n=1 Tax=Stentor coeruleus TaxID=5963 RepID=A0A1R2CPY3_9CILI|nr:hypothetical protein SteCoe_6492 [Stentor coeruleus]